MNLTILDVIALISSFTFYLILIGYICDFAYKNGSAVYWPSLSKGKMYLSFTGILAGIAFLLFLRGMFYILSVFPTKTNGYQLSEIFNFEINGYQLSDVLDFAFVSGVLILLLYSISFLCGFTKRYLFRKRLRTPMLIFRKLPSQIEIIKKINANNNCSIYVKEIYTEDRDYFYYIDLENKWGNIRKSDVVSMKGDIDLENKWGNIRKSD